MRQALFILSLLLLPPTGHAATPEAIARQVVDSVYTQLRNVAGNDDIELYARSKRTFCKNFPSNDFALPDEFAFLTEGKLDDGTGIRCPQYFEKFNELALSFAFAYTPQAPRALKGTEPEFDKKDERVNFVTIPVVKTYTFGPGQDRTFTDTVTVNVDGRYVANVRTSWNHLAAPAAATPAATPVEALRAEAAMLYAQGRYRASYAKYREIAARAADANAYYRLAVLANDKWRDIGLSRREARRLTMAYLEQASRHADWRLQLRQKIDNMLYWLS